MADYTIYSNGIWERLLEKYDDLKEFATKCGVENKPTEAKRIQQKYKRRYGMNCFSDESIVLSENEEELGSILCSIEFTESTFLKQIILTGSFHHSNGADDYAMASLDLVLSDFEDSFRDWYKEIQKKNMSEDSSFSEFYEVFLDVIKLKLDYKIPYTKLFIRKLLEMSSMPKKDSLEIKQYFLKENPKMLLEINSELLE